jgi:RNA polymerase sigma factor (sigma-70 family)
MTDSELVKQVLDGNQGACRFLVLKYQRLVFHVVRRILVHNEDVEDICQEVFMKVFSQLKNFRGAARFSTWVATIAYNTAITSYTRQKRKWDKEVEVERVAEWFPGEDDSLVYESEEIKRHLLALIETLPVHYRTVLTLFYLEEFSYREIEEITGMPSGTVKSYLSRAKFLLKGKLEKMQEHEHTALFRG